MPVTELHKNQAISDYVKSNKDVDIRKTLEERRKLKESGLENIEIRKTAKSLGKNDFLKLLVTQLKHQDPTAPMKDQQFIAQMAQFSSLEQMQNMSSGLERMGNRQTWDLIGKFVIGKDEAGVTRSGVASALVFDKGKNYLKVGKYAVPADNVKVIGEPQAFKPEFGGRAPMKKSPGPASSPAPANSLAPVFEENRVGDKRGGSVGKK